MTKTSDKNSLEEFRYDAKLFKQAYKAGIEAKKEEKENRQRKYIRTIIVILTTIVSVFTATWIFTHLPKKYTYLKTQTLEGNSFSPVKVASNPSDISSSEFDELLVNAQSSIYADLKTGEIIYAKNIDEPLSVASLTKLMTVLVALDNFKIDDLVEVKEDWYEMEDMSWSLELDKGDSITVDNLVNAMLISSYNDAAYALADNYDGGWEEFVKQMNGYSKTLGLENTHFQNPVGLDSEEGNISTVRELYMIAIIIYQNEYIMNILSKYSENITWDIGSERVYSTNSLLGQYGNIGGKTGYTEDAGRCFLGFTKDGKVSIVLNSLDRFADTENLYLQ